MIYYKVLVLIFSFKEHHAPQFAIFLFQYFNQKTNPTISICLKVTFVYGQVSFLPDHATPRRAQRPACRHVLYDELI